jgi:D-3-phosphoglycerate dehydrogenase / 2-oxoglutarate reductase
MLYITNTDKPGFIGALGTIFGNANVNLASFHLGREAAGGNAICLVEVDGDVPDSLVWAVGKIPQVQQVKPLRF